MIRIAIVAIAVLAGCKTRNELSCEAPENMNLDECRGIDAQPSCSDTGECAVGVCKMPENLCVDCLVNTDCTAAATPVCNTTTNTCEACNAHADCDSNACDLDTGACIAEATVAYVAKNGSGAGCTKATPCADLTAAITADKPVIRVVGTGIIDVTATQTLAHDVRIFGDVGSAFRRTTAGPVVTIDADHTIAIEDLVLREGLGTQGDGLLINGANAAVTLQRVLLLGNGGRGLNASAGDTVTLSRCVIVGNLSGGVQLIDVKFDITNTIVAANGSATSNVGGVRVTNGDAASKFQFNTIANNVTVAGDSIHAGVNCNGGFTSANSIVTGNALGIECMFSFSLFDNTTPVLPSGTMNKSGNPLFDVTDPAKADQAKFFRIKDGSPAIDQADPNATEAIDIDGDTRPKGTARDIGADEH